MKKIIISLFIFFLLVLIGTYCYLDNYKKSKIHLNVFEKILTIQPGTTMNQLIDQLSQEKIIQKPLLTKVLIKLEPSLAQIKSGIYQLQSSMSVGELLHLLNSNKGKDRQYKIQFIEGKKLSDYLKLLDQLDIKNKELTGLSDSQIADKFGLTTSLEGWIAPQTYFYTDKMSDLDILKKGYQNQTQILESAWNERDADLPYENAYEMLIMASIIEKETSVANERGKVSSVFVNRLRKKMRLQTDPTIIYGLGNSYNGKIYRSQIKDSNNPYNTYTMNGLPPTPIAMPSIASIYAAAHPELNDYLYFVADGTGGHTFSKNYQDHQKAVGKYRKVKK